MEIQDPHPGAEHHISYLWEMSVINEPIAALHGEKVSVGLMMCLEKYEKILEAIESGKCQVNDNPEFETALLKDTFGRKGLYECILEENGENLLKSIHRNQLGSQLQEIAAELKKLPKSAEMKEKLKKQIV